MFKRIIDNGRYIYNLKFHGCGGVIAGGLGSNLHLDNWGNRGAIFFFLTSLTSMVHTVNTTADTFYS